MDWERATPAGPRRRWVLAVVLGAAALGGAVALARAAPPDAAPDPGLAVVTPDPAPAPGPVPTSAADAIIRSGPWTTLAPAPIEGREDHTATWTGTELIVWGGSAYERAPLPDSGELLTFRDDGAAYDPAAGTWRAVAPAPVPARSGHTAVWTGTEVIVWGGFAPAGR